MIFEKQFKIFILAFLSLTERFSGRAKHVGKAMCFVLGRLVSSYARWILLLQLYLLLLILLLLLVWLVMTLRIPLLCISEVFTSKLWVKLVLIILDHRLRHRLVHTLINSLCLFLILLYTTKTLLLKRQISIFWSEV